MLAMCPEMNYPRILLAQRKAELEQELLMADSLSQRHVIDMELERVEAALDDMKVTD